MSTGFIRIVENPAAPTSCISDRWGWRVEYSQGSCPPGWLDMGRHLIIFGNTHRSDGWWQPSGGGIITATPLRGNGQNGTGIRVQIPAGDSVRLGSWFVVGMVTNRLVNEDSSNSQSWSPGTIIQQLDTKRIDVNWDISWRGNGAPRPRIHFFDGGQKFLIMSDITLGTAYQPEASPGTLIMSPKNISWQPLSVVIGNGGRVNHMGSLGCSPEGRIGWMSSDGSFTDKESKIGGGICE